MAFGAGSFAELPFSALPEAAAGAHTLSGAVTESATDTASGTITYQHTLTGAVTESSVDTATGAISYQHTLSGAVVESGADTASGTILGQSTLSGAVVESGDTATGAISNPQAVVPSKGAGKSKRRRRRIELRGRMYEVDERDIPALLEAVLRDSKPPGTAEVVEPAKPAPKAPQKARKAAPAVSTPQPEPVSVDLVAERVAMLQAEIQRQAEQDVLRMLDRVAQRVMAEVEDEDDALVALLLA